MLVLVQSIWQLQMRTYQWFAEILSDNILSWWQGCHQMSLDVNGLHLYGIFPALTTTQSPPIREWVLCLLGPSNATFHLCGSALKICCQILNVRCHSFRSPPPFLSLPGLHIPLLHLPLLHTSTHTPSPHPHSLSLTLILASFLHLPLLFPFPSSIREQAKSIVWCGLFICWREAEKRRGGRDREVKGGHLRMGEKREQIFGGWGGEGRSRSAGATGLPGVCGAAIQWLTDAVCSFKKGGKYQIANIDKMSHSTFEISSGVIAPLVRWGLNRPRRTLFIYT